MKTRILHTQFWKDGFVRRLNPSDKLVYNYLLTNDKVNIVFCYELTVEEIVFDLGLTKKQVSQSLKVLKENNKISCFKDWVFLLNSCKYESYRGGKNEVSKTKITEKMSPDVLTWFNNPLDRGIDRGIDRGTKIPPISHNTEIISHNTEYKEGKNGIDSLTNEYCQTLSEHYEIEFSKVVKKRDDLLIYCKSTGKKYKDYQATLQSWVRKDLK